MTRLRFALLAAGAAMVPALPALAQHAGHAAPSAPAPAPPPAGTCLPEHAALGHCKMPPAPQPVRQPTVPPAPTSSTPTSTCSPEHAAMGHCKLPAAPKETDEEADPPAGDVVPAKPPEPMAPVCLPEHAAMGHCTPAAPPQPGSSTDPHAGHQMPVLGEPATGHMGEAAGTNLPAGNAPPPPIPSANAADAVYGTPAMDMGRHHLNEFHGGQKFYQVMANIAEYQIRKGRNSFEWDGEAWYGGDINRLWLKTEGEGAFGERIESAEVQALYSRAIDPYWNVQAGLRYDFKPNPSRVYATVGLEGLAPSFFEVEGALFLSNKGELMARAEAAYDQRITQRLILQPRVEVDLSAQNSREIGVGAGLSQAEVGFRLRYDIRREFAPYIGVQYQRAFGRTARYLREEGEDVGGFQFLLGVRAWF